MYCKKSISKYSQSTRCSNSHYIFQKLFIMGKNLNRSMNAMTSMNRTLNYIQVVFPVPYVDWLFLQNLIVVSKMAVCLFIEVHL